MKRAFLIVGIFAIFFARLIYYRFFQEHHKERNVIVFEDSIPAVRDSIKIMNEIMLKFDQKGPITYYFNFVDTLYVDGIAIGVIPAQDDKIFWNKLESQTGLDHAEAQKFGSLSIFLKKNFLKSCSRSGTSGDFLYGYREYVDISWRSSRQICVTDERTATVLAENHELLDKKDGLTLVRYKEE